MKPRLQIILFSASLIFMSCIKDYGPNLEHAYTAYNNNMAGIELYEALTEEQQILLQESLGKQHNFDSHFEKFLGKSPTHPYPHFKVSKGVRKVIKYKQPPRFSKNSFITKPINYLLLLL